MPSSFLSRITTEYSGDPGKCAEMLTCILHSDPLSWDAQPPYVN